MRIINLIKNLFSNGNCSPIEREVRRRLTWRIILLSLFPLPFLLSIIIWLCCLIQLNTGSIDTLLNQNCKITARLCMIESKLRELTGTNKYERCHELSVPVEGRRGVFATVSFDRDKASVKVTHVQRGNHSIGIWIPDKMNDFTPVGADVELNCTFFDKSGKAVFQIHSDKMFKKLWTWCRGMRGGSKEIYCKYSVPKDVPLDEELQLEIKVIGEVNKFLKQYPNAVFSVDKYSDK